MITRGHRIKDSNVLLLGVTFKENCPDIRNSRVIDVIHELQEFGTEVAVYDPWADPDEVKKEYGIDLLDHRPTREEKSTYDAVVVAVAHNQFKELDYAQFSKEGCVLFDLKGILPDEISDQRL
jgi:UDP-N-acetyl-D-galactosamine dehydrogenase